MDQQVVIRMEDLGKRYRIPVGLAGQGVDVLTDTSRNAFDAGLRKLRQSVEGRKKQDFWALKNVSLNIRRGESVGIIGKNGAGKSTMLKLLSRITEPTRGRIELSGRLASMLEVGTGFNGELTGRENVYLNGAILGMGKAEVSRKMDAILEFSEIGKFIDTPVKRYSSGMFVRLGFAVAAHLEPDIMIVDEVLAVGDARFQKKCLEQMAHVVRSGRTILFVSHQMPTIRELCSRVICLKEGRVVFDGETDAGIRCYQMEGGALENDIDLSGKARLGHISGALRMSRLELLDTRDCVYEPEAPIVFRVTMACLLDLQNPTMMLEVEGSRGTVGLSFSEVFAGEMKAGESYQLTMAFQGHRLAPGGYGVSVSVGRGNAFEGISTFDNVLSAFSFEVLSRKQGELRENWKAHWGSVHLPPPEALNFQRL
ncbi:MAG: polysaccharide ABC transporter ATP-binding protein [Oscillospiraceae bacterium]|nr:polysaccharide ABC transporter ATP-binding protein [Oscillospiraceae bacterium]